MEENQVKQEPLEIEPPHEPLLNAHNPQPKRSHTPFFALIGIIVILLVAALGIIFGKENKTSIQSKDTVKTSITPPFEETASLKTYMNTTYNFSFSHPSNYKIVLVDQSKYRNVPTLETANDITLENSNNEPILNILLLSNANETLEKMKQNPTQGGGAPVINMTNTTVDSIPAIKYSLDCTNLKGCFEGPVVQTVYNNVEYIITLHNKDLADQILSTFKFTDQNQVSLTPTISCIPHPACLDATPRCLIAEPASGWCPQ